jgi:hypothetical protein
MKIYLSAASGINPFSNKKLLRLREEKESTTRKNSSALREKIIFTFYNN